MPYTPLAGPLGLTAVPARILAALVGLTAVYVLADEAAKRRFPPDEQISPFPASLRARPRARVG